jgi:hypothetical protein
LPESSERVGRAIIGAAIVYRALGPGLLESVEEQLLTYLRLSGRRLRFF